MLDLSSRGLRHLPPQHAPLVRPRHGGGGLPAHVPGVLPPAPTRRPGEFNWVMGVVLLLLTLLLSYTGYLLPWDQLAFWAVTVGTNMAGYAPLIGKDMRSCCWAAPSSAENALLRFYVLHWWCCRLVLMLFVAVHIWRVRKDGGCPGPARPDPRTRRSSHDPLPVESNDPILVPKRVALVRPDTGPWSARPGEVRHDLPPPDRARSDHPFQIVVIVLSVAALLSTRPWRASPTPWRLPTPPRRPGTSWACRSCCTTSRPVVAGVVLPGPGGGLPGGHPLRRHQPHRRPPVVRRAGAQPGAPPWAWAGPRRGGAPVRRLPVLARGGPHPRRRPAAMFAARERTKGGRARGFLRAVTLPEWIFTWFVLVAAPSSRSSAPSSAGPAGPWCWPWNMNPLA